MNDEYLEMLLEKLNGGDAGAAEEIFLAFEPYLRTVVRRQISARLRSKFDSIDVVQSVWADVLDGFREADWRFTDAAHLRAFLIRVTRNRFIDRLRQHRRSLEHDQPLAGADSEDVPPSREPRPSEVVQAEDLWEQMLALCPPAHHELLRQKQRGLPLSEIAARSGLHESSVRRILYDLERRFAEGRKNRPTT
jgi:RNA polymerase sigma-70 factor (ECF subfamily)